MKTASCRGDKSRGFLLSKGEERIIMNRHQKKVLTLAVAIGNLSFSIAVASVSTYAWYTGAVAPTITSTGVSISAPDLKLDYEILKYSDDDKAGVSYVDPAEFFLPEYDDYITDRNIYANVILRTKVNFGTLDTSTKELKIDIIKLVNTFKTAGVINSYTSNVIQFKSTVYSYTTLGSNTPTINESDIQETATGAQGTFKSISDAKYQTARIYFSERDTPTTYVAIKNGELIKTTDSTITIVPDLYGKGMLSSAVIYIECSYHETLVDKYIESQGGEPTSVHSLTGDIDQIVFSVGDYSKGANNTGKYLRIKSNSNATDGKYLPTYESESLVLDGRKANTPVASIETSTGINTNQNGLSVSNQLNSTVGYIASTDEIDSAAFTYEHTNGTFKSMDGYYIGNNTGTDGIKAENDPTNYHHTVSFDGNDSEVIASSGSNYRLRFNKSNGVKKFAYYNNKMEKIQLYRYYENSSTLAELTNISVTAPTGADKTFYVGDTFTLKGVTVTATYTRSDSTTYTIDVTTSCSYSYSGTPYVPNSTGLTTARNNMQIDVSFNDGATKTGSYTIDVISNPVLSISITSDITKRNYYVGETFDMTGLVVTATRTYGNPIDVTNLCSFTLGGSAITDGTTLSSSGEKAFVASYSGKSDTKNNYINIVQYSVVIDSTKSVNKGDSTTISYSANAAITWTVTSGSDKISISENSTAYIEENCATQSGTITITGLAAGTATVKAEITGHSSFYSQCTVTVVSIITGTITKENSDIGTTALTAETIKSYAIGSAGKYLNVLWSAGCFNSNSYNEFVIPKTSGYLKPATGETAKITSIIIEYYKNENVTVKSGENTVTGTSIEATSGETDAVAKEYVINSTNWQIVNTSANNQFIYFITFNIDESTICPSYTMSFNKNGGGGSQPSETSTGLTYVLPECTFTAPTGKTFDKWAMGSAGGTQYDTGDTVTVSSDTEFYAIWKNSSSSTVLSFSSGEYSGSGTSGKITWTVSGVVTIVQTKGSSSTNVNKSYVSSPRWYQSHIITFTPASGKTITKIEFTCGNSDYANILGTNSTWSAGSCSVSGTSVTWTGTATDAFTVKMDAQSRPGTSITIYYS